MVGNLHILRRLGIPGSAVTVLSELSTGEKTTTEMSKSSGLSRSAIINGIKYWQEAGVAKRFETNKWQITKLSHVTDLTSILKDEESELITSIAKLDQILIDV